MALSSVFSGRQRAPRPVSFAPCPSRRGPRPTAGPATNEEYGIERLKHDIDAALPHLPADAVNRIAANVDRFVGPSQSDDRTLVYCHRPL